MFDVYRLDDEGNPQEWGFRRELENAKGYARACAEATPGERYIVVNALTTKEEARFIGEVVTHVVVRELVEPPDMMDLDPPARSHAAALEGN